MGNATGILQDGIRNRVPTGTGPSLRGPLARGIRRHGSAQRRVPGRAPRVEGTLPRHPGQANFDVPADQKQRGQLKKYVTTDGGLCVKVQLLRPQLQATSERSWVQAADAFRHIVDGVERQVWLDTPLVPTSRLLMKDVKLQRANSRFEHAKGGASFVPADAGRRRRRHVHDRTEVRGGDTSCARG